MTGHMKPLLSDDHIRAIGALVVAVSELDSLMTDLIAAVTGSGIVSALITVHHQQFVSKVHSLLALSDLAFKGDPQFGKVQTLIKKAGAIAEYRNSLVHGHWTVDAEGVAHTVRFQARGKFSRSKRAISSSEIQARAEEALSLAARLANFRDHLLSAHTGASTADHSE
jgi:hypothetical protein